MRQGLEMNHFNLVAALNALEDSDVPICIDTVDWHQAGDEFRKTVLMQGVCVIKP